MHTVSSLCRIGEARAYWSLCNACAALGDHREALHYAQRHLRMAVELRDEEGEAMARQNLAELSAVMELSDKFECPSPSLKLSGALSPSLFALSGGEE